MAASKKLHDLIDILADPYAGNCASKDDKRQVFFATQNFSYDDASEATWCVMSLSPAELEAVERVMGYYDDFQSDKSLSEKEKDILRSISCPVAEAIAVQDLGETLENLAPDNLPSQFVVLVDSETSEKINNELYDLSVAYLDAELTVDGGIHFEGYEKYCDTPIALSVYRDDLNKMRMTLEQNQADAPQA